jgi:hypothetical protein
MPRSKNFLNEVIKASKSSNLSIYDLGWSTAVIEPGSKISDYFEVNEPSLNDFPEEYRGAYLKVLENI